MNIETIIKHYFQHLEKGDYHGVNQIFYADAIVISPLYGERKASDFYKELFIDTNQSKISLKNIFISSDQKNVAAAHFFTIGQ